MECLEDPKHPWPEARRGGRYGGRECVLSGIIYMSERPDTRGRGLAVARGVDGAEVQRLVAVSSLVNSLQIK